MRKKDYFWADIMIEDERRETKLPDNASLELIYPHRDKAHRIVNAAERHALSGDVVSCKKTLQQLPQGYAGVNVSSINGIPDFVVVRETDCQTKEERSALNRSMLEGLRGYGSPYRGMIQWAGDITSIRIAPSKANGQVLTGSCNAREEESVKLASKLTKLSFSAFVTKATLYMARFINRHRRNEQGHPYHPGEAYLFMEHGKRMQDAFTPEEVQQSMEKVGISGSRIANDLMAELERLRDARMNPEAGSMDVPE